VLLNVKLEIKNIQDISFRFSGLGDVVDLETRSRRIKFLDGISGAHILTDLVISKVSHSNKMGIDPLADEVVSEGIFINRFVSEDHKRNIQKIFPIILAEERKEIFGQGASIIGTTLLDNPFSGLSHVRSIDVFAHDLESPVSFNGRINLTIFDSGIGKLFPRAVFELEVKSDLLVGFTVEDGFVFKTEEMEGNEIFRDESETQMGSKLPHSVVEPDSVSQDLFVDAVQEGSNSAKIVVRAASRGGGRLSSLFSFRLSGRFGSLGNFSSGQDEANQKESEDGLLHPEGN